MFSKWRKCKHTFQIGDKVVLRYDWYKFQSKYPVCAYCKDNPGKIYTVTRLGDSPNMYIKPVDDDYLDHYLGHTTCANSQYMFLLAMTIEECIDIIYQKVTEALFKPR
jgi:hypothetical protein